MKHAGTAAHIDIKFAGISYMSSHEVLQASIILVNVPDIYILT